MLAPLEPVRVLGAAAVGVGALPALLAAGLVAIAAVSPWRHLPRRGEVVLEMGETAECRAKKARRHPAALKRR
eukprot:8569926-Pyramimonas_sp.AAC.1